MTSRILHIAKYEFLNFFVSPIAWLLLTVFVVQTSITYLQLLNSLAVGIFQGIGNQSITATIFENDNVGLYAGVAEYALLYVPLLTMGLLAREVSSGSIKLLQSSPVGDLEIVLGKYIAVGAYFFIFVLYLIFLIIFTGFLAPNISYLSALNGALGVFLLMTAYAAIGLFMSSLTQHQVVAAVSTLAILAVLSFIGSVGQRVPVLSEVAFWFSSDVRVNSFVEGLFVSKDFFYFASITILFVGLTYLKLAGQRQTLSIQQRIFRLGGFVFGVVAFGIVTSSAHLTYYFDTTPNDRRSPRGDIPAIISETDGPLKITAFVNVLDSKVTDFLPSERRALSRRFLDDIRRYNPEVSTDYVFYYGPSDNDLLYNRNPGMSDEQIARRFAEENRLPFDGILSTDEAAALADVERFNFKPFYVIEYDGLAVEISTFNDASYHPNRLEYATALKTMQSGSIQVGMLSGAGERSAFLKGPDQYVQILSDHRERSSIENMGFDVFEVVPNRRLSEDIDILVIADPTRAYTTDELAALTQYVNSGADLLVLVEPQRAEASEDLLKVLGLTLSQSDLRQTNEGLSDDISFVVIDGAAQEATGIELPRTIPAVEVFAKGSLVPASQSVVLHGGGALRVHDNSGFDVVPVLRANPETTSLGSDGLDSEVAAGLLLVRQQNAKEQRIAVIADADFISTSVINDQTIAVHANRRFITTLFGWFSRNEYPINTERAMHLDTSLRLGLAEIDYLKIVLYWVFPLLIVLVGSRFLVRRRRA